MSPGAWMMLLALVLALGSLGVVVYALVRSILNERTGARTLWREFGLGLVLMLLFFGSWFAHGIAEWQVFTDEQREHGQPVEIGDFVSSFGQSTLENWQSEFLQLFAFVALSAMFIHRGSAESKDTDEKIEASLRRIEEHLGTLPPHPRDEGDGWKLPDTSQEVQAR
jgi:Domain of unknown function (DUF6766)